MFTPNDSHSTITLKNYKLKVYDISNFSFNDDLNVSTQSGIYCFTNRHFVDVTVNYGKNKSIYAHTLEYLGMADGNEGLSQRLKSNHEKFPILKGNANCLCLYECSSTEDAKKIESDILSSFSFTFNTSENEDDTKPHIIYED